MLKRPDASKKLVREMSRLSSSGGSSVQGSGPLLPEEVIQPFRLIIHRCQRLYFHTGENTFKAVPFMPADFQQTLATKARLARSLFQQQAAQQQAQQASLHRDQQQLWEAELFASPSDRTYRTLWYGPNEMQLPVKDLHTLITEELLQPLYVSQYASVTIWFLEEFYGQAAVILGITAVALFITCWTAHRSQARLASLAAFSCPVLVPGTGSSPAPTTVSSTDMVPGDLVWVGNGQLPHDAVLLVGSCTVDESSLTGEPHPVRKSTFADGRVGYHPEQCQTSTLFAGTQVLHACGPEGCPGALALVCRTGAHTARGQLTRSLLDRSASLPHFNADAVKYIGCLLLVAIACFTWALVTLRSPYIPAGTLILRALDLVTIAVPPGLPACLAVAMCVAMWRLWKIGIDVAAPQKLLLAGNIDTCLFDKTGTLTEAGLQMRGMVLKPDRGQPYEAALVEQVASCSEGIQQNLATCHSLAVLQGQVTGDPLDHQLFTATGWQLSQDGREARPAGRPRQACAILHRWDFTAESRRSMVLVQALADGSLWVHCKGAPEVLEGLVRPCSLPQDYPQALAHHTSAGMRVVALASGRLSREPRDIATMPRAAAEACLDFVGLALLENPIRPESQGVITSMQAAQIRTALVTGDHVHTAISVARQCGLLPSHRPTAVVDAEAGVGLLTCLAPDRSFQVMDLPSLLPLIAEGGASCAVTAKGWEWAQAQHNLLLEQVLLGQAGVWARMGPADKQALVLRMSAPHPCSPMPQAVKGRLDSPSIKPAALDIIKPAALEMHKPSAPKISGESGRPLWGLGAQVAFCGDGANDAGALKAASVAVSLCQSGNGVAAPFSSQHQSISCMLQVLLQGRSSLTTAFLVFKYILAYATCQLIATTLLYSYGLRMGSYQYLIQDLFFSTTLAACLGLAKPAAKLAIRRPPMRLLSPSVYLPLILQLALCALMQAFALGILSQESWYQRPDRRTAAFLEARSPENTVVFLVSLAQLVMLALIFDSRDLHRKPFWKNAYIAATATKQCIFILYLLATDGERFSYDFCGIVEVPGEMRFRLLCLIGAQILLALSLEKFIAALLMQQPHKSGC
ncbi:hypothetical protein WJX74_009842 [Apatococcus lobatus]|uniref:P-type ATPase A domain-containing protein n=1 Tax=Apatococcus lobatus TaxID=904363 RepID=A0AAW1S6W1_9CHLO